MTIDDLKPFIDWMQAHPHLAGLATFIISIAESLAIIGLFIPGTIVMGAIGSLVGSGVLPSLNIIAWASAGAIVGDGISYWLGYHYHEKIRVMWPFRLMPGLLKKGEIFFLKHGGKSVFMGRFIGPIRPIIPVIAGMMNMHPTRFTIANITSAVTWAPAYMLPGYVLGAISVQLAPHTATRFLVMAIIALLSLWFIYWIIRQLTTLMLRWLNAGLNHLWEAINSSSSPMLRTASVRLADPLNPHSNSQLAILLTISITLLLFMWLSFARHSHMLTSFNQAIWTLARDLRTISLDHLMLPTTLLSELPIAEALIGGVLIWLLIKRQWRTASHWLMNGLLVVSIISLLQIIFKTSLPEGLRLSLTGWSYPSLRMGLSTAILGFFTVILVRGNRRYYRWWYALTVLIALSIGISRLYFGAAWFTDVLGGYLIGLSCLLVITLSYRSKPAQISSLGVAIVGLLSLGIAWTWYYATHSQAVLAQYKPHITLQSLQSDRWWDDQDRPQQLYRKNLSGKPIELLNIQWAGNIEAIQRNLIQQGWLVTPKPNLAIILNRIAAKNRQAQLPVFPYIYQHQKPHLIMTKYVVNQQRMLVLRLWDAHITLTDKKLPLWLGSVAFHRPWKFHFPYQSEAAQTDYNYEQAMQIIKMDLGDFISKEVPVSLEQCAKVLDSCSTNILFVKPK